MSTWSKHELRKIVEADDLHISPFRGNSEQLPFHLQRAKENGVTEAELIETITHLAFYSGWPKAMSAITVAKEIFRKQQ